MRTGHTALWCPGIDLHLSCNRNSIKDFLSEGASLHRILHFFSHWTENGSLGDTGWSPECGICLDLTLCQNIPLSGTCLEKGCTRETGVIKWDSNRCKYHWGFLTLCPGLRETALGDGCYWGFRWELFPQEAGSVRWCHWDDIATFFSWLPILHPSTILTSLYTREMCKPIWQMKKQTLHKIQACLRYLKPQTGH